MGSVHGRCRGGVANAPRPFPSFRNTESNGASVVLTTLRILGVVLLAAAAGCTQTKGFKPEGLVSGTVAVERVLLMPADVELSEMMASGLLEPNAQWTAQGIANVDAALRANLNGRGATLVRYETSDDPLSQMAPEHRQIAKLHEAVGRSILVHKYIEALQLPTKKETFDWTLGTGARALGDDYGADYALFIHARDSFTSAGRVAVIFAAALFGVGVPGAQQQAFASLVDLDTGQVVWFNVLVSTGGDLRKPESAQTSIDELLSDLPI